MKITAMKTYITRDGNRPRALIKVETDEDLYGWGEAYNHGPDLAIKPTIDYIFEMIKGEDPRRIEYIMLKIFQQLRFPPGSIGLAAMSALDHALWDISGKAAGLPVYMLLGGNVRDRIQVYRGVGGRDGKEAAENARKLNEEWGFTAFKTSPYKLSPDSHRWGMVCDAAARYFEELRDNTPQEWLFAFDAHAKIFEPIQALQLANALAPYDPYFYEEPLRPEHIPAWSRLRSQLQVPLATGECLYTRFDFLELLTAQGADIIQPDICTCGGLLEMRKIAAIAEAHYVTVAPHNPMGPLATAVNLHFAAATPNFKILEYLLPGDNHWLEDPYVPIDGFLELRDRPGFGVEVNEEAISKDSYIHWQRTCPVRPDGSTGYI
ncbi:mandelate racemase/muconate lactonizing enzyme family protein [Candidatus Poribacteria bacterium]|nr:mandelate racemase/muconate lactonizing enzyme family protein [Candidatus Poribacteria bacterium]